MRDGGYYISIATGARADGRYDHVHGQPDARVLAGGRRDRDEPAPAPDPTAPGTRADRREPLTLSKARANERARPSPRAPRHSETAHASSERDRVPSGASVPPRCR